MFNLEEVPHHPAVEEIAKSLSLAANNADVAFFRLLAAHYLAIPASAMHASVRMIDEDWPINTYMLAIAESGAGKGVGTGKMREKFLKPFRLRFRDEVMPAIAEKNLFVRAQDAAIMNDTSEEIEYDRISKFYGSKGAYTFDMAEGSSPAAKQLREKIQLAGCGSLNLQIDEIGKNLEGSQEILTLFMELFDQGYAGTKIKVSNADNKREMDLEGMSPANLLAFGEPTAVFDGGAVERVFRAMLSSGYARRFIFAYGRNIPLNAELTVEEEYKLLQEKSDDPALNGLIDHIASLADPAMHGWIIRMPDEVAILNLEYRRYGKARAEKLGRYETVQKAELMHRWSKVLKLAGAYAFLDQCSNMTKDHYLMAMKMAEESGESFQELLHQERPSEKLARYIAEKGTELTRDDLEADLPFFKGTKGPQTQMLENAVAWGYKNHIIIKKTWADGIEFFSGESLTETSLGDMKFSYSDDYAYGYAVNPDPVAFSDLHKLTQAPGMHWANHTFDKGHRHEDKIISGFNMIVLDIDGGVSLNLVHELLANYKFMTYTTKRHTPEENRFRLILPTNYHLKLDKEEYREFMNSLMAWLPLPPESLDKGANQRSKKWESNAKGTYFYSDGEDLLDVLPFVPKTSRNEEYQKQSKELKSMDNLERWMAEKWSSGNRNNLMLNFALALVDHGLDYNTVENRVLNFNAQLSDCLSPDELKRTVLVTAARRVAGHP